MNKQENVQTDKYANACNAVNEFVDSVLGAFGIEPSEKYHINRTELKKYVDDINDEVNNEDSESSGSDSDKSAYIKLNDGKLVVDFSNFIDVWKDIEKKYKEKYCNKEATHTAPTTVENKFPEDNISINENEMDSKIYTADMSDDLYCNGDCENCKCPCLEEDLFDEETPDYVGIKERLQMEFNDMHAEEDDDHMNEDPCYPYEEVLMDITSILEDPESTEYELIPAGSNDKVTKDTVFIKYHIGYDSPEDHQIVYNYGTRLRDDLKELFGFSSIYISTEDNSDEEYITMYIYMEM